MTCKDCIHGEVCLQQYSGLNQDQMFAECKKFKNKADFVEVVRCKDCERWDFENIKMHTRSSSDPTPDEFAECKKWSNWSVCRMLRHDDFCVYGKRREEGNV